MELNQLISSKRKESSDENISILQKAGIPIPPKLLISTSSSNNKKGKPTKASKNKKHSNQGDLE